MHHSYLNATIMTRFETVINMVRVERGHSFHRTVCNLSFDSRVPGRNQLTMEQQSFFSETNLEVLCKVAASTFPDDRPFDAGSPADRQRLYGAMHTVFTSTRNHGLPISTLNKQVLRTMLVGISADAERTTTQPSLPDDVDRPSSPVMRRGSARAAGIRDLETHARPVPTMFQARPQQTSMAVFDTAEVNGSGQVRDQGHDFQAQLQAYESTRAEDTPSDRVEPVDFTLETESDALDDEEATRRMEALMAARDTVSVQHAEPTGMDTGRQEGLVAAMETFEAQNVHVDEEIEAEQERQDKQRQTDKQAFRATQTYQGEGSGVAEEDAMTKTVAEAEAEDHPSPEDIPAEDLATSGAYWLDETVRLNLDVNGRPKVDQCAFQDALQLTREERALNEKLRVQAPTLHEHLLLPPPKEYVTHTHFLEVSSSDRVRTLNVTETPYDFTVYFGTTMPAWRTYPVWLNNPIEYDTEEAETAEIRRSLGLRGLPAPAENYSETLGDVIEYIDIPLPNQSQNNVDTVFRNVVAFKVHCVQLYFSTDSDGKSTCYQYPYLLLEIQDFCNVYRSTNNAVRKSFCKLYYDASNCTTLVDSKHHEYIPKYSDGMTFATPRASIDRLQFRLLDPTGAIVSTAHDTYFVTELSIDIVAALITVTLHHHIPDKTVATNDLVRFKDLEWYSKADWDTWLALDRVQAQMDQYDDVQSKYTAALKTAATDDDRRKLRAQFEKDQVDFDYPTLGCPVNQDLVKLKACLERPEGHRIVENPLPSTNTLTLSIPTQFDPETGLKEDLLTTIPGGYQLLNGVMLHESRTTNISLTVVERDVAPTLEAVNT